LLAADGSERSIALGSKAHMASDIWDAVVSLTRN
jgi:phosphopantothenoylcysteine decarboxylase / phosphopantothenate---cysteine ligase